MNNGGDMVDKDYTGTVTVFGGVAALIASFWLNLDGLVKAWFWLAGIDTLAGLLAAAYLNQLNMDSAWKGAQKKAMVLLMIGMGAVLDMYAVSSSVGLPVSLAAGVAGSFAVKETLSVLRHATSMGLSIPEPFASVAAKFSVASTKPPSVPLPSSVRKETPA